jgi:hypothetical protein
MEKAGKRIGFIGIGEKDWTDTFRNIEVEVEYQSYKDVAEHYV